MSRFWFNAVIFSAAVFLNGCILSDYECEGVGTCEDPKVCYELTSGEEFDAYYVVDGTTYWCDDGNCEQATAKMSAHCGW
ncbi:MAG TPA: hypothetical protein PLY68_06235 [Myxococcota bacterium]|nr:hypothetical protein [Myxococcota bacterium]HNZ04356.1 hypothetical protein [Myxococcota bacterium]HOD06840.1 hypothetical protein [Myxococcota bacterium]HPB50569.1 hypothetical protein [Myxococcota bacterium]HQP95780.1 hypothetical protein [Myxococcota bacterium]